MGLRNMEIPRPKYYRLLEHPFTLSVLENDKIVSEPLSEQASKAHKLGQKPKYSFTPEMAYHFNVGYYSRSLISTLERIEQVPIFLRRFPNSKFFIDNSVTLHKWVNYHYTNFLVMSVSLYDIALLLTNEIFMLGIEARFCNEKSVVKHKLVKETSVKTCLDNLGHAVDEYRDPRHLFVHRGRVPSMGFLDDLDTFDFLQKARNDLDIEKATDNLSNVLSNPYILKALYKIERKNLIAQIEQKTNIFVELIFEFFSSQKPIYDSVSKQVKP